MAPMQRQNSAISPAFVEAVNDFLALHTPVADAAQWRQAVCDQGWAVPHWSVGSGGQGWSPQQYLFWQNACVAASAPLPDPLTVSGIGPMLSSLGAQRWAGAIAAIRTLEERWCLAAPDAEGLSDQALTLHSGRLGPQLNGSLAPVVGALQSQWLLCLAQRSVAPGTAGPPAPVPEPDPDPDPDPDPVLVAVSAAATGLTLQPLAMVGEVSAGHVGNEVLMASLVCKDVVIEPAAVLAEGSAVEPWLTTLAAYAPALNPERASAAALKRQLADLLLLREHQQETGEFDAQGADFAIRLSALEVLEQRLLDAPQSQPGPEDSGIPGLRMMQQLKSLELQQELADAQAGLLGYYLLPYADPGLSHNEPAAGPPLARERVAAMLAGRGLLAAHDPLGLQIGRLAEVLGLGEARP
ncbi:MAG: hypothetical protein AB8B93_08370 [Pseudomonadales bacterium]